jgi:hypothetical protein
VRSAQQTAQHKYGDCCFWGGGQYIGHGWQRASYWECSVPAKVDYAYKKGGYFFLKNVKKKNLYFENS